MGEFGIVQDREEIFIIDIVSFCFLLNTLRKVAIACFNPLQCSCLENLRDGGAWWAAVLGVAQSRTRLKRLSSSSSSSNDFSPHDTHSPVLILSVSSFIYFSPWHHWTWGTPMWMLKPLKLASELLQYGFTTGIYSKSRYILFSS